MKFTYEHDIPTVEAAMRQGIQQWSGDPRTNPLTLDYLNEKIEATTTATITEIRNIFSSELATLFDAAAVAQEWNQAVERCIQLVEGRLR